MTITHAVIPDVQAKNGNDFTFLYNIGKYLAEKKPEVIVCLGDFADMPSLSFYDKGKKSFEGRQYTKDLEAAAEAMESLMTPILAEQERLRKNKEKRWKPRMVLTLGNHEDRISRAIEEDRKLEGLISIDDLPYQDWEVYPFLEIVSVDGINYSHYFTSGVMNRPCTSARQLLTKKHQSCVQGHVQTLDIATDYRADGTTITGLFAGCCLTPDHKVLTADLQYKELGYIKVGDALVSFDEDVVDKRSRRYKTGIVEAVKRADKECFIVTLESGKQFKVTGDHRWLVKTGSNYHWRTTDSLRVGTCIPKLFDEWEQNLSYDAGWLSGMYDGEGSLSQRTTTGGTTMQLAVSQNEGRVLDRLLESISTFGFDSGSRVANGRSCWQTRIIGGTTEVARFLGTFRPTRLLDKFKPEFLGRINSPNENNDKVVSIEPIGIQEIVQIAIDAKTMIVEGYPHHNCYEHDEDYLTRQGNNYFRGIHMLHEVDNGSFLHHAISLSYLNKRYE